MRTLTRLLLLAVVACAVPCWSQEHSGSGTPDVNVEVYFRRYVGLSGGQIKALRAGKAISKTLPSRTPAEIFVFGAVYVNASPDAYLGFASDFDRLKTISGYLAIGKLSAPPQLSDLNGFTFDSKDIEALKKCKPADCDLQLPEGSMHRIQNTIDWSASDVADQVNQMLQKRALDRLLAYQREGNSALGMYNDKEQPTDVAGQFQYILSYTRFLPERLPEFYRYLLTYPREKPENVQDLFYWTKVKFGLKPTLRMIHVVTEITNTANGRGYAIAEKQIYASHYFQTALDLTFCIPEPPGKQRGFYLIKVMGSEQAGLTGFKGTIVRRVAVGRSASTLQKSLASIKNVLEQRQ
ncbi:MAG: hypothetical protein ACM3JB_10705 [Acidobacteriaceae bacterium]